MSVFYLIQCRIITNYNKYKLLTATLQQISNSGISHKTPEELWKGQKPNVSHMKIFGCEAMFHLPKPKRKKLDPKSIKLTFVGYCNNTKGYRFIKPCTRNVRVIISRDAVFVESTVERKYASLELSETENSNEEINEHKNESYSTDSSYNTVKDKTDSDSEYLPEKQ